MKVDFLKGLGLEDDVISKIQAESGKDVTEAKTKLQTQVDTLTQQNTDLQGQVAQRDADLTELNTKLTNAGQSATKLTQVQTDLTNLQTKYNTEKTEWESKLAKQNYEFLVKEAVSGMKFTSNAAKKEFISGLVEKKLPVENDKLLGIDDYVASQKEADPGIFAVETPPDNPNNSKPNFVPPANQTNPPAPTDDESKFGFHFIGVRQPDKK